MTGHSRSTAVAGEPVTEVAVDRARARIYAEGWQSWSPVDWTPVDRPTTPPASDESALIDYQDGVRPDPGRVQASGLLAIDAGDGSTHLVAAPDARSRVPCIDARLSGERVVVCADGPVEVWIDRGPGGPDASLARYADDFARRAGLGTIRPQPAAWCSWYHYFSEVTDADVEENLVAMDSLGLPVGVVQLDDGYEAAPGDWLIPSGRVHDLPGLVRTVRNCGRRAGIWLAPLLVGADSQLMAEHPDWVVRDRERGDPIRAGQVVRQECVALDVTHPGAAAWLRGVVETMRGWGIDYFKLDFLYAGALPGRRHTPVTGVEAYRQGLYLLREAAGAEATFLGCGAPLLPSVGLVDAMRVGPDVALTWEPDGRADTLPSQRNATRNCRARAWQQGRWWINDPDCIVVRSEMQRREEWAATVAAFGGLRASGDRLAALDQWGLEATRQLLVPARTSAFRADR